MTADDGVPLGYLLYRAGVALRGEVSAGLTPLRLAFGEYLCLRMVADRPGQSNADLARRSGVTPQAMNQVVRSLQQRGLVERPAAATAGRALPARLTAAGESLLARASAVVRDAEERLLAEVDADARRALRASLIALGAAVAP